MPVKLNLQLVYNMRLRIAEHRCPALNVSRRAGQNELEARQGLTLNSNLPSKLEKVSTPPRKVGVQGIQMVCEVSQLIFPFIREMSPCALGVAWLQKLQKASKSKQDTF